MERSAFFSAHRTEIESLIPQRREDLRPIGRHRHILEDLLGERDVRRPDLDGDGAFKPRDVSF